MNRRPLTFTSACPQLPVSATDFETGLGRNRPGTEPELFQCHLPSKLIADKITKFNNLISNIDISDKSNKEIFKDYEFLKSALIKSLEYEEKEKIKRTEMKEAIQHQLLCNLVYLSMWS